MSEEMRDRPTMVTPLEWRVLLRHAGANQLSNEAIAAYLEDSGERPTIDAATDATLRARMGRPREQPRRE